MKKYFLISVFSPSKGRFATVFSDITDRKKAEDEIKSLSRFALENPDPVMRINDKNFVIDANEPAKQLLTHFGAKKRTEFLKFLNDSAEKENKEENVQFKTVEIKIGDLFYEFHIVPVKEFNYFNIYGRDITGKKEAAKLDNKIKREKAVHEERNKLARELHDTVTQTLFSADLVAQTIPKLWKINPEVVVKKLDDIKQLHNVALAEMHILLYELRPSALKDESLKDLIKRLVKSFQARCEIPIELKITGDYEFPSKIKLGFYRITQEALNNISKHSNASKVNIILEISPEKLYLEIGDNGRGFEGKEIKTTSLGLKIMRERAKIMRASIDIATSHSEGTKIAVIYKKKLLKKKSI